MFHQVEENLFIRGSEAFQKNSMIDLLISTLN